jgi:hypothetical protein
MRSNTMGSIHRAHVNPTAPQRRPRLHLMQIEDSADRCGVVTGAVFRIYPILGIPLELRILPERKI